MYIEPSFPNVSIAPCMLPDILGEGEMAGSKKLFLVAVALKSSCRFLFIVISGGRDAFLCVRLPLTGVFILVGLLLRIMS